MEFIFKYTDNRQWKYEFIVSDGDNKYVEIHAWNELGHQVHTEFVAFSPAWRWMSYHTRQDFPLVSKEAREFCEKSVGSYMKLKAFW